jgi:hypothetical protein
MGSREADDRSLETAGRVSSAALVDAMGRSHRHRCHILDLASPTPGRVLFGPAVTISFFPACSASMDPDKVNFAGLFYEAVGAEPAGKVLEQIESDDVAHLETIRAERLPALQKSPARPGPIVGRDTSRRTK